MSTAILGGGCFWCLEAVYESLRGVNSVVSGYEGGTVADPTYEQVCTKKTGHIEVVKIEFDPSTIDYRDLLEIFFTIHDPTSIDRQGDDVGPQYRSAIFCLDSEQRRTAEETIAQLTSENLFDQPIVTKLLDHTIFYPAETYHQGYYRAHPENPYCAFVVSAKVAKFRARHASKLKD